MHILPIQLNIDGRPNHCAVGLANLEHADRVTVGFTNICCAFWDTDLCQSYRCSIQHAKQPGPDLCSDTH